MNADSEPADNHAAWIVAIARRQDRKAFAGLFAHFAPRVKTYLLRRGCDAARAEELAQEAMLSVWRKAALYDPSRATAAAWIFAIARNLWIDAVRRSRLPPPALDPSDEPAPEPLADTLLVADDRARRLHAALQDLRPEQIEPLRLAFFEDRSHAEIEQLLGVPLGTVKSRLRLALSRLRAALGDDA
ncbi:MAG: sigma-70 family RNA polymerase sigma factor [Proteobacteria bacterium]|nr:sigma-70 family RNA polymerase sigma factor [Pseudomonadota bacterium]